MASEGRGSEVDALLGRLTPAEKAALTAGADFWSTVGIDRLGIPPVWMTDGPNGVRGAALTGAGESLPATCVPCGAALGATWDPALVERVGALIAAEARERGYRVLLAPTVNLHRSPLGGRNFESYSEDPLLAGTLAAAYVRGVQSQEVVATVKHFAGNESETDRMTMDAVIDERSLRELYLVPFELAVRHGGALAVMTAYNRLNGVYCSDNEHLLRDILRAEWGFQGFVVTDWAARGTTVGAARAGVDLEMPGPGRFFGRALADAVASGEVDEASVDAAVRRLLRVFARVGVLDPVQRPAPAVDRGRHRALARRAAVDAAVLLKNDRGLLPIDTGSLRTLAVLGPNADHIAVSGGGSAHLPASDAVSLLGALRDRLPDGVQVLHEPGVDIARFAPVLTAAELTAPDGRPGMLLEVFAGHDLTGDAVERGHRSSAELTFLDANPTSARPEFSARATAAFTATSTGPYVFSLAQLGRARLLVDGAVVLDGMTHPPPPGTSFVGLGSAELTTTVDLDAGRAVQLVVEFTNIGAGLLAGVRIGCRPPPVPDQLDRAVAAAARADAVIVVAGTSDEWESEGHDRTSMSLPGGQDDLIERVLAVNPRTVVVVNAGTVLAMPWAERAPAVLQAWFAGQGAGEALADVLLGAAEPGGRLPTTVPLRVEQTPSYRDSPAENGHVRYAEGVLVGYRWYDARRLPTRFPFGHGLGYTTFVIGRPRLSAPAFRPGEVLEVDVPVTNTGARAGREVVQCYLAPPRSRLTRPVRELKAFAKVELEPGDTALARLTLGERAFAYWDDAVGSTDGRRGWTVDPGVYELHVGRSSADIAHVVPVAVVTG